MELIKIDSSETLLINELSKNEIEKGNQVVKFGFGQSPFLPPDHIVDSLRLNASSKEYTPVQGLLGLRKNIAAFHSKLLNNTTFDESQVFVSSGSKMLLFSILMAFKSARVFLVTPSWVSYEPQAHLIGHNVCRIQTNYDDRWRLTAAVLDEELSKNQDSKQKILIMNYPGNPDGLSYTDEELVELAQVARKHNLLIISDEIYGLLDFEGRYSSIVDFYPENTIVTTGLSKWCGAGGWRLGVMLIPKALSGDFKEVILGIASETYSCAPSPVQWAAIDAYDSYEKVLDYLSLQRHILRNIGTYCAEKLRSIGVRCYDPVGGFYIMPDFEVFRDALAEKGIFGAQELCQSLLEDVGVAVLPGTAFGYPKDYLTLRLAFVDFDGQSLMKQLSDSPQLLNDPLFVKLYAPNVYLGINKMLSWVKEKGLG